MKIALVPFLALVATPAAATPAEDFAACLIGHAVIALEAQGPQKDAMAAMGTARTKCPEPAGLDPEDESGEAIFYLVEEIAMKVMTDKMAAE